MTIITIKQISQDWNKGVLISLLHEWKDATLINTKIYHNSNCAGIHHSKYWMRIHDDTIEDGQNKTSHHLFSNCFFSLSNPGNIQPSDCDDCTPGKYCAGTENTAPTQDCDQGYYCPAGQQSPHPDDYNCTIGHYCPTGSPDPVPCEAGTYQDEIGTWECKPCPAG